jgi:hypothetical protein
MFEFYLFLFKNAIILYYACKNMWLYNREYPKPKCGLLQRNHICFESICFEMCATSIQGPLVVIKCLNNSYHIDCKHGS